MNSTRTECCKGLRWKYFTQKVNTQLCSMLPSFQMRQNGKSHFPGMVGTHVHQEWVKEQKGKKKAEAKDCSFKEVSDARNKRNRRQLEESLGLSEFLLSEVNNHCILILCRFQVCITGTWYVYINEFTTKSPILYFIKHFSLHLCPKLFLRY